MKTSTILLVVAILLSCKPTSRPELQEEQVVIEAIVDSLPEPIVTNPSKSISDPALAQFFQDFEVVEFPIKINEIPETEEIDKDTVRKLLGVDPDAEEGWYTTFFYGLVFYQPNYIGLLPFRNGTPGVAGVNNFYVDLFTFDYAGNRLDSKEIGCYCYDSNMGSNEYFASELNILIDSSYIKIKQKDIHATLFENEADEAFEKIETTNYDFKLSEEGMILE